MKQNTKIYGTEPQNTWDMEQNQTIIFIKNVYKIYGTEHENMEQKQNHKIYGTEQMHIIIFL